MYKVVAICNNRILVLNIFADKNVAIKYANDIRNKYKDCKIRIVCGDESNEDLIIP